MKKKRNRRLSPADLCYWWILSEGQMLSSAVCATDETTTLQWIAENPWLNRQPWLSSHINRSFKERKSTKNNLAHNRVFLLTCLHAFIDVLKFTKLKKKCHFYCMVILKVNVEKGSAGAEEMAQLKGACCSCWRLEFDSQTLCQVPHNHL